MLLRLCLLTVSAEGGKRSKDLCSVLPAHFRVTDRKIVVIVLGAVLSHYIRIIQKITSLRLMPTYLFIALRHCGALYKVYAP